MQVSGFMLVNIDPAKKTHRILNTEFRSQKSSPSFCYGPLVLVCIEAGKSA